MLFIVLFFCIELILTLILTKYINNYIDLLLKGIVVIVIPNLINILIFYKSSEFIKLQKRFINIMENKLSINKKRI